MLLINDFNSLISENISDLDAPFIYEKIGTKYNNYFIDEFQDTSELQWKNLIPLASHALLNEELDDVAGNLFIVGDPKQSVYRWRGARPETFIELSNNNPFFIEPSFGDLEINRRTFSNLVDFNNSFFKHISANNKSKKLDSIYGSLNQDHEKDKKGGYISISLFPPKFYTTGKINEIYERVLKLISWKQKQGFNLSDITILCRVNKECNLISSFLIENNIRVKSEELLALSSSKEVNFIINLIKLKYNKHDSQAKKDIVKFISSKSNSSDQYNFISQKLKLDIDHLFHDSLGINYNYYSDLDLFQGVEYIISKIDFFKSATMQVNFLLDEVFSFINSKLSHKESFIQYWERKKEKLKVNLIEESNAVKVLTIHKAKGLEFPTVFIAGLEQGLFPLVRIDDAPDQIEEERRLFYVAVTRAMDQLYLLNAKYRRRFGAMNTTSFVQSDFLNEIDEDVIKIKSYKSVYTRRIVGTGEQKKIQISRTVTEFDDFKIGDQVQHNLFGIGTILVLSGSGENQKVGVEFDGGLRKKLIVKYARLKKID